MHEEPLNPWDGARMTRRLLDVVVKLPRQRLDRLEAPRRPGCYLTFFATEKVEGVLGRPVATGRRCAYVGVSERDLRERVSRYPLNIRGAEAVSPEEIWLALLPCDRAASAAFAERALIEALTPVLNGLGWGSQPQGSNRVHQRPSPVDALIGPRAWVAPSSSVDAAVARLRALARLAELDVDGPRWPPLPVIPGAAPCGAAGPEPPDHSPRGVRVPGAEATWRPVRELVLLGTVRPARERRSR